MLMLNPPLQGKLIEVSLGMVAGWAALPKRSLEDANLGLEDLKFLGVQIVQARLQGLGQVTSLLAVRTNRPGPAS